MPVLAGGEVQFLTELDTAEMSQARKVLPRSAGSAALANLA
jgi:hypothetical protein